MSIKTIIKDPKDGNEAVVDKFRAIGTFDQIPELPPTGTRNRRQFFRSTITGMLGVGTLAAPVLYTLSSDTEADLHITSIVVTIGGAKVKEDKYGDIAGLTNGVDLISYEGFDTNYIAQDVKSIGEFSYQTGATTLDTRVKTSGGEVGVIQIDLAAIIPLGIRLAKGSDDRIVFQVKDDLSTLVSHDIYFLGFKHVE